MSIRKHELPSIDLLREYFHYDESIGELLWKKSINRRIKIGSPAGTAATNGYKSFVFKGVRIRIHRAVLAINLGRWPKDHVDHINGDTSDNRLINLRECLPAENSQNVRSHRKSTSKHLGVSWVSKRGKWVAQIMVGGKQRKLGYFDNEDEAASAYAIAKKRLHTFSPEVRVA